jgi:hypothetical protein
MSIVSKKVAWFVGGALFGSAGVKLLSSKDAKKFYTHTTAAVLRMKDCVMQTADLVRENCGDILASAKDINEARAAAAEQEVEDAAAQAETAQAPAEAAPVAAQ